MAARAEPRLPTLYVLECEDAKFYVGKTYLPVWKRFRQHCFGPRRTAWTRKYTPLRIVHRAPCEPFDELKVTLTLMREYGIDNVRGDTWCMPRLAKEDRLAIERQINAEESRCYQCNRLDHLSLECPESRWAHDDADDLSDSSAEES